MKKKIGSPTTNMDKGFSADEQNVGDNGGQGAPAASGQELKQRKDAPKSGGKKK